MKSIQDTWQKETKQVKDNIFGDTILTLYKDDGNVMGITSANAVSGDIFNESWTYTGCVALVEAGEMKFFEPDNCPKPEEVQHWFDAGETDFAIEDAA